MEPSRREMGAGPSVDVARPGAEPSAAPARLWSGSCTDAYVGRRRIPHRSRALFKVAACLSFVGLTCLMNVAKHGSYRAPLAPRLRASGQVSTYTRDGRKPFRLLRRLDGEDEDEDDEDCPGKPGYGLFFGSIVVVLYLFLGTAIICDELFVPALEVMAEKWGLSDDVAGATLMAAGGSAPELATSFIGTFKRTEVGFGTIVGSAVFNVLFVIGMCAVFTPPELAPLKLTWWPLARDCGYYAVTLCTLGAWFALVSPNQIQWWEALIQFGLYIGYVGLMSQNEKLEKYVKEDLLKLPPEEEAAGAREIELPVAAAGVRLEEAPPPPAETPESARKDGSAPRRRSSSRPGNFRAGIGRMLLGHSANIVLQTGVVAVTQIAGDVDATFDQLDNDSNGVLDLTELGALLERLGDGFAPDDKQVDELRAEMDPAGGGTVSRESFRVWYLASETRLRNEARRLFEEFDANRSGDIDVQECQNIIDHLSERWGLQPRLTAPELHAEMGGGKARVTFDEFRQWYESSVFYEAAKVEAELQAETVKSLRQTTMEGLASLGEASPREKLVILGTLPLNLVLGCTVPDCTVPGNEKYCYATFVASIVWIGVFAYLMVEGIENIGDQLGVPVFIMALTFLAAGTSVPDLLSSVVVAKHGKGDMAVSSSIGSNIFDVAVGLPLPWLFYTVIFWENVQLGDKDDKKAGQKVGISIGILLVMVVAVIVSISASGWKMSRALGATMFGLYLLYVAQEILRAALSDEFDC